MDFADEIVKVIRDYKALPHPQLKKELKKICKDNNIDWFYVDAYFWQPIKEGEFKISCQ